MSRGLWFAMSARTRRSLTVLWIALFLSSLALQYVQMAAPAPALAASGLKAQTVQGFEVDGDLKSGNASTNPGTVPNALIVSPPMADGDDWLQGPANNNVVSLPSTSTASAFLYTDATDPGDDSAYGGGNKEDDTRDWEYTNSAGPNPKTDFKHIMASARKVGNSAFVYLGAERIENNGTMVVDFELNKKPFKQFSVGPKKPDRSVGDLLISLEYSNGGSNPVVTLYRISAVNEFATGQTVTFSAVSDADTLDAVRSATNFGELTNSGFGYPVPAFDFAEASIDLSELGITLGCPGFSSGHIRSRTGGDPGSSQLKDAAPAFPIDLNNCGKVTIVKDAVPNAAQDFDFTTTGGNSLSDFSLDDDSNGTLSDTKVFPVVVPGTYTVTEAALGGWKLTDLDCSDDDSTVDTTARTATIVVGNNESVTCTFTNTKLGKIIVEKQTIPDGSAGSFSFTGDVAGSIGDGGQLVLDGLLPGTYTSTETAPALPFDLGSIACDDANSTGDVATRTATFRLAAGETITCTFTNVKRGTITIIKNAVPNVPQDFGFTTTGSGLSSFTLDDDGDTSNTWTNTTTFENLIAGAGYSVTESDVPGWELTGLVCDGTKGSSGTKSGSTANIDLTAGGSVTCTFTNTKAGRIIVDKVTVPGGDAQLFTFTPSYNGGQTFQLADATTPNNSGSLEPGTYSVSEAAVTGWDLTDASCTDGSPVSAISLQAGETVTCTFTNTKRGTIIVEKQTSPDGATGDFAFTGDAAGTLSDGEQIVVGSLVPGTYASTEAAPGEDWNLGAISCDDGQSAGASSGDVVTRTATFELDPGETVTCVFTNVLDGSITIIKQADPADGTDFGFTTQGAGLSAFSLDDDENGTLSDTRTFLSLDPSSGYQVAESALAGWDLDKVECNTTGSGTSATPAGNGVAMTLGTGGSITCTFFNDKPSIDIVKTAGNATDGGTYTTLAGNVTYTYVVTNDGANTLVDIEIVDDNGTPADASDDFGTADGTITCDVSPRVLDAGASMTCTATIAVADSRTNTAVANASSVKGTPVDDEDDAKVVIRKPQIDLDKDTVPGGTVSVGENAVVQFVIEVAVIDGPVTNAVITDTLPAGQAYVAGSQTSSIPATFQQSGQVLTWTFASLSTGDPAVTVGYQVTIAANAGGQDLTNTAEVCVDEIPTCDEDDVTVKVPDILLIKTAGTAADGAVFATEPGPVTYSYRVTNSGPLTLMNVTVSDDAGTPADASDDFAATCPKTTLASGESMTCTFTRSVLVDTVNVAIARGVTVAGTPTQDDDDAKVEILEHGLVIDKSNDAPLETLELPDGSTTDLPTADEGDTVTYTLVYTFAGDPVTNAIITDVLPVGVTYIAGSAADDDQFTFQGYDAATRTLTWTAPGVNKNGSVSYQATVDVGASELPQPLVNVAAIDSDQTPRDDDDSPVFVPTIPLAATGTPRVTLPPTDLLDTPQSSTSNLGFNLMLILLALAAVVLVIGFVTPVPASVRERPRR